MSEFLEIVKYILPLAALLISILLILRHFSNSEKNKQKFDILQSNSKITTPIRLQAYERLVLLLERIKPDSMALRLQKPNLSALQMQILMLATVRKEFNHNLSQQIYISQESWEHIINAKEQVTKLINITALKVKKGASSGEYIKTLIETYHNFDNKPIEKAILAIKKEALYFFGR